MGIPRDILEFLDGYPLNHDDPHQSENLGFYSNIIRCRPNDILIEEIHHRWAGDYHRLEKEHGYIQWLFPIQERGVNVESQALQKHEIVAMKSNPKITERLITSYKMMLDFFGMRLVSEQLGTVDRALPPKDFASRYRNLVRAPHNNLRISRILKCLSEFDLEILNVGFLLYVLVEQSESNQLNTTSIRNSMDNWWSNCIRNEQIREWVGQMILHVRSHSGRYVFRREIYRDVLEKRLFLAAHQVLDEIR